jgi:hypothetical protein
VYLSTPAKLDDKPIVLIPEMDGKRMKKEEEAPEVPQERMITLPDGRQVPASMMQNRPAGTMNGGANGAATGGGQRQGGQQRQGSRPAGGGTQPAN